MSKPKKASAPVESAEAAVAVDEVLSAHKADRGKWSLELVSASSSYPPNIMGHGKVPDAVASEIDRRYLVYASDQADIVAGDELMVTIDNDSRLSGRKDSIFANLDKKLKKGQYDPALAVVLWRHFVDEGAKSYAKDFASERDWSRMFTVPTRDYVARRLAREYEVEWRIQHEGAKDDEPSPNSSALKQSLKR